MSIDYTLLARTIIPKKWMSTQDISYVDLQTPYVISDLTLPAFAYRGGKGGCFGFPVPGGTRAHPYCGPRCVDQPNRKFLKVDTNIVSSETVHPTNDIAQFSHVLPSQSSVLNSLSFSSLAPACMMARVKRLRRLLRVHFWGRDKAPTAVISLLPPIKRCRSVSECNFHSLISSSSSTP